MRFSRNFSERKYFFSSKKLLSLTQARFFILEEAALLFLIVIQLYRVFGIEFTKSTVLFELPKLTLQNELWLIASIAFFLLGYLVVARRDETVQLIHKNFALVLLGATKSRLQTTTREQIIFVFGELMFATILGISIFLYLDPEINVIPAPMNYLAFVFFLAVSLILFSHTKQFRLMMYGPTPIQKRIHHGHEELRRITNSKTGTIRLVSKKHFHHRHSKKR
jgi:hypothetical protein